MGWAQSAQSQAKPLPPSVTTKCNSLAPLIFASSLAGPVFLVINFDSATALGPVTLPEGLGPGLLLGLGLRPLLSRLVYKSFSTNLLGTPPLGTSALATQTIALRTVLRKLSSPQLRWLCPPVKPNPRPPLGRSKAQATCCGSPAATLLRTAGLPLWAPSPRLMVSLGATSERIGVTPFISGAKRIWKYHSSFALKGLTPCVIGCLGSFLKLAIQWGFTDQCVSKQPPCHLMNSLLPLLVVGSTA